MVDRSRFLCYASWFFYNGRWPERIANSMEKVVFVLFVLIGLGAVADWHEQNDRISDVPSSDAQAEVASFEPAVSVAATERRIARSPERPVTGTYLREDGKNGLDGCPRARPLIEAHGVKYDVPKGELYGVWQTESHGICGGFSDHWQKAIDLVKEGDGPGDCVISRGYAKCRRNFRALRDICAQTRNGVPICDPNEVRTSPALAMGPYQIMPTTFFAWSEEEGRYVPKGHAVDCDGDGVFDPHDLCDAMASAAVLLRERYLKAMAEGYDAFGAWQIAANLYNGAITIDGRENPYYAGKREGHGVRHHWNRWCEITGSCKAWAIASR